MPSSTPDVLFPSSTPDVLFQVSSTGLAPTATSLYQSFTSLSSQPISSAHVTVSTYLPSSVVISSGLSRTTSSPTIVIVTSAVVVSEGGSEIPSGSIFTALPGATPISSPSSGSDSTTSWHAALIALLCFAFILLLLRFGVYLLFRYAPRSAPIARWPRWLQLLCCYRPRAEEEDEQEEHGELPFVREAFMETGGSYSVASRAQALALIRGASASWRERLRQQYQRPVSPSTDDPVPPYPGPPIQPPQDPFADPITMQQGGEECNTVIGTKETDSSNEAGHAS